MPKVSALMVFHQVTPFLEPAVRSVLEQTHRDLELVLVDNGSGQGLAPLGATGRDPRIQLVTLPHNLGIAGGLNHAMAHARGEFFALLDYDDLAKPARIEKQVAALNANPNVDLVSSYVETIDERGKVVGREFSVIDGFDQRFYLQFSMPVVTPAYTGRRAVFLRHLYRTQFRWCSDYDLFSRAAESSTFIGIPEVLLQYRRYPGQASSVRRLERFIEECFIRLLGARRRAGRDEQFDVLMSEMRAWLAEPIPLQQLYANSARQFLREGFSELAVYHARKLVAAQRAPGAFWRAAGIVRAAITLAPRQRWLLLRLFLRGPVNAYRLRDDPARA